MYWSRSLYDCSLGLRGSAGVSRSHRSPSLVLGFGLVNRREQGMKDGIGIELVVWENENLKTVGTCVVCGIGGVEGV